MSILSYAPEMFIPNEYYDQLTLILNVVSLVMTIHPIQIVKLMLLHLQLIFAINTSLLF